MHHSAHRYYSRLPAEENSYELTSRMVSRTSLPKATFDPLHEHTQDKDGIFGKMTSKVSGIFKGLKNAVGSISDILKTKEEEHIMARSATPTKIEISVRDVKSLPVKHQGISKVNFTELSHILQKSVPLESQNKNFLDKPHIPTINMSFGGSHASAGNVDPLNQSTFSFQSQSPSSIETFSYY